MYIMIQQIMAAGRQCSVPNSSIYVLVFFVSYFEVVGYQFCDIFICFHSYHFHECQY